MTKREFKVMATKIFTGREKRVEDFTEIINEKTEKIKKNQLEMKKKKL